MSESKYTELDKVDLEKCHDSSNSQTFFGNFYSYVGWACEKVDPFVRPLQNLATTVWFSINAINKYYDEFPKDFVSIDLISFMLTSSFNMVDGAKSIINDQDAYDKVPGVVEFLSSIASIALKGCGLEFGANIAMIFAIFCKMRCGFNNPQINNSKDKLCQTILSTLEATSVLCGFDNRIEQVIPPVMGTVASAGEFAVSVCSNFAKP